MSKFKFYESAPIIGSTDKPQKTPINAKANAMRIARFIRSTYKSRRIKQPIKPDPALVDAVARLFAR